MRISLDRQSDIPLYQQIEAHLRQSILSGGLPAETRLPASRALARDLGVNRITVETAYTNLEAEGLIAGRLGSGTYVLPLTAQPAMPHPSTGEDWPLWQQEAHLLTSAAEAADIEELLHAAGHPRPISFAGGGGDARSFPAEELRKALQMVMRRDGAAGMGYGDPCGYAPLRSTIAQVLASQGLLLDPDHMLVTSGSQQAMALVAQLLLKPGDTVLVETPTYSGALDLFRMLRIKVVGLPTDEQGMQVDRLEKTLQQHHPRLIYTIPNFHNPTGTCLGSQRRRQLLALADRYNVPILEDDYVGDLRYEGRTQPALKSLDPGGRVIYLSTFSKMLMPGLRVGFLAVEGPIYAQLVTCKRVSDLASSNLVQRALEAYVTIGRYQAHLRRSCLIYRRRRDVMLAAIARHLPSAQVAPPQGGLFIWLRLPDNLSADDLLPPACRAGVAFAPGSRFFVNAADGAHYIRLNFVTQQEEGIEEGIVRLRKVMRNA